MRTAVRAVTLAGRTELRGVLSLPQNGLAYGRVGADFFRGREIPRMAVRRSEGRFPRRQGRPKPVSGAFCECAADARRRFARQSAMPIPAGLHGFPARRCRDRRMSAPGTNRTLRRRTAHRLRVPDRASADLRPQITVGSGARITAQLFARDTIVVEARAVLEYPSGNLCRTVCRDRRPRRGERLCDRPRYGAPQKGDGFPTASPARHGFAACFGWTASRRCRVFRDARCCGRRSIFRRRAIIRICFTTSRCSKIPSRPGRSGWHRSGGRRRHASNDRTVCPQPAPQAEGRFAAGGGRGGSTVPDAFAAVMELIPRLTVRGDDALLVAEAEYRVGRTFENTAPGCGPAANMPRRMVGVR